MPVGSGPLKANRTSVARAAAKRRRVSSNQRCEPKKPTDNPVAAPSPEEAKQHPGAPARTRVQSLGQETLEPEACSAPLETMAEMTMIVSIKS
jgi:hypothetical protein